MIGSSVLKFNRQLLKSRIEGLAPPCRFLFALCIAERLFPLYQLYCARAIQDRLVTGTQVLERVRYLESTRIQLWQMTHEDKEGRAEPFLNDYQSLIPAGDLVPASEVDANPFSALAEFAILALHSACECRRTGDSECAVWAAESGGYAAVDYIAHSIEGMSYDSPEAESAILKKDYVQAELKRQRRDIKELATITKRGSPISYVSREFRVRALIEGLRLKGIVAWLLRS